MQEIIRKYTEIPGCGNKHAALASALGSLIWGNPLYSEFQHLARYIIFVHLWKCFYMLVKLNSCISPSGILYSVYGQISVLTSDVLFLFVLRLLFDLCSLGKVNMLLGLLSMAMLLIMSQYPHIGWNLIWGISKASINLLKIMGSSWILKEVF